MEEAAKQKVVIFHHKKTLWRAQVSHFQNNAVTSTRDVEVDTETFRVHCPCKYKNEYGCPCFHSMALIIVWMPLFP
jgi:hypothetical protein